MRLDKKKRDDLLHYVGSIAVTYYRKHKIIYEKDAVSLHDLVQEAKIICLKMIKKYGKLDGKKNFDIKKFTSRAVGWRLRDLLNGAIVHHKNNLYIEDMYLPDESGDRTSYVPEALNYEYLAHWKKEDFYNEIEPTLIYGFSVKDVFKHFKGKDLTILKKMIECKSMREVHKELKCKDNSVRNAWIQRIRPQLLELLKKNLSEIAS
jgi:hypothetical protein